jgi:hypothetical protein
MPRAAKRNCFEEPSHTFISRTAKRRLHTNNCYADSTEDRCTENTASTNTPCNNLFCRPTGVCRLPLTTTTNYAHRDKPSLASAAQPGRLADVAEIQQPLRVHRLQEMQTYHFVRSLLIGTASWIPSPSASLPDHTWRCCDLSQSWRSLGGFPPFDADELCPMDIWQYQEV